MTKQERSASQIQTTPLPARKGQGGGSVGSRNGSSLLSTAYLPPVQWFAHFAAAQHVLIEQHEHYLKQTYRNRCVIAGPDGPVDLSIPLEKASSHAEIRDLRISDHGHWRHHHWNAIRSAYGHSPFFEYYADDFAPFYERPAGFLLDFNEALIALVAQLLDIDTTYERTTHFILPQAQDRSIVHSPLSIVHCPLSLSSDLRSLISPRTPHRADAAFIPVPYYQVFQQRLGFLPNLSIADLLFNMGPEGLIVLQKSISKKSTETFGEIE